MLDFFPNTIKSVYSTAPSAQGFETQVADWDLLGILHSQTLVLILAQHSRDCWLYVE